MNNKSCQYLFQMPGRPRERCNLATHHGDNCIFHSHTSNTKEFFEKLEKEIQKADHWLEGIIFHHDLKNINLTYSKMPQANFAGINLEFVSLDHSNLEGSIFRNSKLEGVSFYSSNLQDVVFDLAKFIKSENTIIDFRDSEIGGATFTGVNFSTLRLQNIKISKPTRITYFLNSSIFEFKNGNWDIAAYIYSTLGDRARKDWDNLSEDKATFMAMTCRHRRIIKAAPVFNFPSIKNWIVPTFNEGLKGILWYLHRVSWGYGYKPFRLIICMVSVIILFATFFLLFNSLNSESTIHIFINSLLLSTQSFFSMTYGKIIPTNKIGETLGTFEAFIGTVFVSLFVVSLTVKFMRRV